MPSSDLPVSPDAGDYYNFRCSGSPSNQIQAGTSVREIRASAIMSERKKFPYVRVPTGNILPERKYYMLIAGRQLSVIAGQSLFTFLFGTSY